MISGTRQDSARQLRQVANVQLGVVVKDAKPWLLLSYTEPSLCAWTRWVDSCGQWQLEDTRLPPVFEQMMHLKRLGRVINWVHHARRG